MLEKLFPLSYRAKSLGSLILYIIIYVVAPTLVGVVVNIINGILSTILGGFWGIFSCIIGIVLWLLGIYCTIGFILAILVFLKVLK